MARRLLFALFVGLFSASGCTTCDNPYDDCGPVVDAGFHPAGLRAGSLTAMPTVTPEVIPAPPSPPMAPTDEGDIEPDMDQPPEMEDLETTSVMRPRLRYAR